jgi:hypothetical protein
MCYNDSACRRAARLAGGCGVEAWRIGLATLATGLALSGCAPPPPPPPPAPVVSYDGTYRGMVTLTDSGAGVPREGCITVPQIVLQVKNNAFTYTQVHPKANVTAPNMPIESADAIYTVSIAPNGTFSGQSQLSGTISGVIAGTHMTGTIEGLVCVYSFSADRV